MKKPIIVTMMCSYEHDRDGGFVGDMFPEIIAIGYDAAAARAEAIHSLRYSCQLDHTRPSTIQNGYGRLYGAVSAMELEPGDDPDDDELFDYEFYSFGGVKYAVRSDWDEQLGGNITSEELRAEELRAQEEED